jgi:hypothetical protein
MAEDRFRLPQLWRRVLLGGLVLIAGPTLAWSAIWFTRSYVVPARVPVHRPVAIAAPTPAPAPVERIAHVAPASAAVNPLYTLAMAGNEGLQIAAPVTARTVETTGSIARVETVPLPRPKPRTMVAAIRGPVPLPRPRPVPAE